MPQFDFTTSDLIREVRRVAEGYPTYVYKRPIKEGSCLYFHPGQDDQHESCGCIFGHALSALGVSLGDIGEEHNDNSILQLLLVSGVESTGEQADWMWLVQYKQDKGKTWKEAINIADNACGAVS